LSLLVSTTYPSMPSPRVRVDR